MFSNCRKRQLPLWLETRESQENPKLENKQRKQVERLNSKFFKRFFLAHQIFWSKLFKKIAAEFTS